MSRKGLYPLQPGGLLNEFRTPTASLSDCSVLTLHIADSAVTYAKIQSVTGSRLLGRFDTTTGTVQEIRLGSNLSFDTDNDELDASGAALSDCSVLTQHIKDSAVSSVKLLDSAVTAAKLDASSVTTAKIADSNVTAAKLDGSSVTSAKLADSAVLTAKISDSQVTYAKIQAVTAVRLLGRYDAAAGVVQEISLAGGLTFDSNAGTISSDTTIAATLTDSQVDSSILADAAVSTLGLQDSAVTAAKIDSTAITTVKINDAAVTSAKLGDTSVTTAKINDAAVTSAKLGDTSVTTAKINDDAVTFAKIQNITGSRLLGRHDTTSGDMQEITVSGGLSFDTSNDALTSDSVAGASETVAGRVEFATSAEMTTGTDTTRAPSVRTFTQSEYGTRIIEVIVSDTTLVVGDGKAYFNIPPEMNSWDLIDVDACVTTSSTTGNPTIQIANVTQGTDILSTKITLDTGEKTSYTAATPPVINGANDSVVTGDELRIDVDSAGTAAGLRVIFQFRKP